ncbi:MAG: hypothetical protein ABFS38_09690 [Bacteroidota bacterium]
MASKGLDFLKIIRIIDENRLSFFTTRELAEIIHVEPKSIQNYLESLANNELIIRLEKGKYCRTYIKDRWVIGSNLISGGFVSHKSALTYHSLIKENTAEVFISSDHQKSNKTLYGTLYHFIKIRPHKYFGFYEEANMDGKLRVTDPEKTMIDCFDLPQYSVNYSALINLLIGMQLDEEKLINYGIKMQNLSVLKRMAYLSDKFDLLGLQRFRNTVSRLVNNKYTLLDPTGPDAGPFSSKWKIRNNMIESFSK